MTYRAFIGMNMARKHNINFIFNKPWFIHNPHGFTFHVVIIVAIIPWRVHYNNQPWSLGSVDFW